MKALHEGLFHHFPFQCDFRFWLIILQFLLFFLTEGFFWVFFPLQNPCQYIGLFDRQRAGPESDQRRDGRRFRL